MTAIGKWSCSVKTPVFSGSAVIDVYDDNGKYNYRVCESDVSVPRIKIKSVTENGNTVDAVVELAALPGTDIPVHAEFEENTFTGYIKVPLFGKIPLRDGHRV